MNNVVGNLSFIDTHSGDIDHAALPGDLAGPLTEPTLEEPPIFLEDHDALAQLVVVDLAECIYPSLNLPIVQNVLATNYLGTIPDVLLAHLAVCWPLPVLEVLQLFVADPHGLRDQLGRHPQELRHVLGVKGLLVVVKVVLKAEEGVHQGLEVATRIKYLMLR